MQDKKTRNRQVIKLNSQPMGKMMTVEDVDEDEPQ